MNLPWNRAFERGIMSKPRATWNEKLRSSKAPEVKRLHRAFGGMPEGSRMLIASPIILDESVRMICPGQTMTVKCLRDHLANRYLADHACPVTTGIFLRIVAEAAWERYFAGESIESITPFWRVVEPDSLLARKLACGRDFIVQQRLAESQLLMGKART